MPRVSDSRAENMKHTLLSALLALCMALSACNAGEQAPGENRAAAPAAAASPPVSSPATPACPSQDFDKFFVAFAGDAQVQKAHVAMPLESETIDSNAEPEPKPVIKQLALSELKFPLLPDPQQQAQDKLELTKTVSDATHVEIKLAKPDTDYQMVYLFRNDGCWTLYRTRDDSL